MKLTREEVHRVALLARLRLSREEEERLTEQLDKILDYVETLNRLDTSEVEPFVHATDIFNVFREDRVTNQPKVDEFLANAPARDGRFIEVPKIIE
ncbi:MAG TPA: Asp-tRNA(Asn)/Glu-tRNA(Gln) amidotransferase subunit GatC [Terriglobales bacterium]|nr:Asp-tRNA(Asn)/Glu-tRNA(Gln) amidotransferase subunit GatC [Terriglobales bacterium]